MYKNLIPKQRKAFEKLQKDFDAAKEKYLQEVRKYKYFENSELLSSPPVKRAAYSDRMAWAMASMSMLAYEPFEAKDAGASLGLFISKLDSGGFTLIEVFSVEGTQAFLAHNQEYAVLAFRGTEQNWVDLQTDLRANRINTPQGKIHTGFIQAYELVADQILNVLPQIKDLPLYITGHSLGGALAAMAAQRLEDSRFKDSIAACYTFGSPRVGNIEFDTNVKVPFYRVVNFFDIVTLIPLGTMGFTDAGDVRFISSKGRLRRYLPFYRFFLLALLIPTISLDNHRNQNYIDRLWKIMMERNPSLMRSI